MRQRRIEALLDPGDKATVDSYPFDESPELAFTNVMNFWGNPTINRPTKAVLMDFARKSGQQADSAKWKRQPYRVMRQNAMRTLLAMSPDQQTS